MIITNKALNGKRVALCHRGSLGNAIWLRLATEGAEMHEWFSEKLMHDLPNIAICTSGKMLIQHPATVSELSLQRMFDLNYRIPRIFTERMLDAGAKLIIHIGSNSARYGKSFAEDYSAMKCGLWKFCEIRGALAAKENGARITCVNLGGVNNGFWDHIRGTEGFDVEASANLIPVSDKAMTNAEVAEVVLALCLLPENVCVKDLLVTAKAYQ